MTAYECDRGGAEGFEPLGRAERPAEAVRALLDVEFVTAVAVHVRINGTEGTWTYRTREGTEEGDEPTEVAPAPVPGAWRPPAGWRTSAEDQGISTDGTTELTA